MKAINVRENVQRYLCGGGKDMGQHPDGRYASFDYCFNYFQAFREQGRIADICSNQECPANLPTAWVLILRVGEC